MPTTTVSAVGVAPLTAAGLLARVGAFGPLVEAGALVFATHPPPDLVPVLRVLHTGMRAVLTGRQWFGNTCADGARVRLVELDPAEPIPPRVGLVCAEGDARWDRIHPAARLDLPDLFAPHEPNAADSDIRRGAPSAGRV